MSRINLILYISLLSISCYAQKAISLDNWRFKTGDSLNWKMPNYNDSKWESIKTGYYWESQGYKNYCGYAWYRIKFMLPSEIKNAYSDSLLISLGKIDDCDQTFLNGELIGQNAKINKSDNDTLLIDMYRLKWARNKSRNYCLPLNDPRLLWNGENVLAVRVLNMHGMGGLYTSPVFVRMKNNTDCLVFDIDKEGLKITENGRLYKSIIIENNSRHQDVRGKLTLKITDSETNMTVSRQTYNVYVGAKDKVRFVINFKGDKSKKRKITYRFIEAGTDNMVTCTKDIQYILTPKPTNNPKINGAKVVGVGPCSDFIFRIPATGKKPMSFFVDNLPEGLTLDESNGIIKGKVKGAGDYIVNLIAINELGKDTSTLKVVVGNRLALTPPMGWNSWNGLGYDVSQRKVEQAADILVSSGLADHGYKYVNTDIGWEPMQRDPNGGIVPNQKFPNMKAMTDYIHSYGLQAGIYISPGPTACSVNGTPLGIGSYGYNETDARTFADWGFDYLKYDWCSYPAKDYSRKEIQKPYRMMKAALNKTDRDFVYSLAAWDEWEWGDSIGANLWRVVTDIEDNWESVKKGFNIEISAPYAKPGNWNDPDMLVIGHGWFGDNIERTHPSRLTPDEQYSHISLWSMLSAPLLIGCDLTKLDEFTINLLSNDEVIAIDQDPLGKQALSVVKNEDYVIMVKDLEDGSKAVGLFNLSKSDLKISIPWKMLQLSGENIVRDLWRQKDLGVFTDTFESIVPIHGVMLVNIRKK